MMTDIEESSKAGTSVTVGQSEKTKSMESTWIRHPGNPSRTYAATSRRFYTEKPLHREAFTQRSFSTEQSFHTGQCLHRSFYTEKPLE